MMLINESLEQYFLWLFIERTCAAIVLFSIALSTIYLTYRYNGELKENKNPFFILVGFFSSILILCGFYQTLGAVKVILAPKAVLVEKILKK